MGNCSCKKKEKSNKYLYLGGLQTNDINIKKLCSELKISINKIEVKHHPRSNEKINDFIIEPKISAEELFYKKIIHLYWLEDFLYLIILNVQVPKQVVYALDLMIRKINRKLVVKKNIKFLHI